MYRILLTLYLTYLISCPVIAQEKELEYSQKLSISEGLAHNGVTCILNDSKGYLWISTYDGLNRFDGYDCKIYKNTLEKDLFVSNRIRTIAEDTKGNLWLGTDEGITVYNHTKEKYWNIYSNKQAQTGISGPIVRKIFVNEKQGKVICATEGDGILVFNEDFTLLKKFPAPLKGKHKTILFHDGFELDESNYALSSSAGLVLFNSETGKYSRPFENDIFDSKAILKVNEKTFLIQRGWGLSVVNFKKEDGVYSFKKKSNILKKKQLTCMALDKLGNLWLGASQAGVIHINNADNFINNRPYKSSYFHSQTGFLRTSCFLATENNGCWVGSFDKGLFQIKLQENPFKYFNTDMGLKYSVKSNEILQVLPIDKDRLYLSANAGGTALFNSRTEQFEPLPFRFSPQMELGTSILFVDSHKNTWIRQKGQIGIIKSGKSIVKYIAHDSFPDFSHAVPRSLSEDKYGNIWMGCVEDVYRISLNKAGDIRNVEALNMHEHFADNKFSLVRYVYVDPLFNFIWVGNDNDGLIRIKNEKGKPLNQLKVDQYLNDKKNKLSISSNFVSSIIRLPNSELWIGTERGGINKVINSDKEPEFISFSEKQGLSNNVVKNILYDDAYNLWIPTNIGLNKFDTKDFRFRTFGTQDGLPFEDFSYPATQLGNGKFIFCGLDGFFLVSPNDVGNQEVLPKVCFGEITVFNKPVLPGDTLNSRVLFKEQLGNNDELELKHNEKVFSIEIASLHFSTPENHFIKYKLSPLNSEWVEVPSDQNKVYYNGLQPGEYELKVMASNSLNEWTDPIVLRIIVKPPFWLTIPAFLLYFLFVSLIISAVMYYILRMNKLQHNLEIEQLEKDKVKEVNEAKLRFFSNISHEIKTPLTLISGPVNLLAERFKSNDDVHEKLRIVQRQSRKMLRLVNQVHDFQRADANQLKMNCTRFCFNDFVVELVNDFMFKASNDKKKLEVDHWDDKIYVLADKDKMEKVMNNLLNNAFKFTKTGDSIKVVFETRGNELIVKVADTGKGIDKDDLPHIFERFYQSSKKHSEYTGGSGIGLAFAKRLIEMHDGTVEVESHFHHGSVFTIKLPVLSKSVDDALHIEQEKVLEVEKEFDKQELATESIDPADIKVDGDFTEAKVFFVEDNTDMRTFISGVLSNFFEVRSFTNGIECLKTMEEEWPDIVISDVLMPEMNGFDLCKSIKSEIKTSHIPVILLTACTTIEDNLKGLKVGADSYIKKPFNVQHLVTRTETLLRIRKKLRERFQLDFPLVLEKREDNNNDIAFLEDLYALMEENLDNQNLDLNRFAKALYLNRTHFYKKVKALTNKTPFELLKTYRLKKAADLLVQKQLSVNEVYIMTGFKSRTHFSKLFKETYSISPGKYASEMLNKDKLL